tara:strand:- start:1095 stop:1271 length:177 start_codon:yes stop_codon:yes gene_type:complete
LCAEVSPPPPPSADKSIYAEVMENDPIGYQNLLAKMEQWCVPSIQTLNPRRPTQTLRI